MRRTANCVLVAGGLIWLGYTFRGQVDEILTGTAGRDFHDYYYSTKAFRHGASIYDHEAMSALATKGTGVPWVPLYVYPPYLTIVFLPFLKLRYDAARIIWLILSYVFLFGSVDAMRRVCALAGKRPVDWRLRWLAPIYAPNLFAPLLEHNWYGQSNMIILFLVSWGIWLEWKHSTTNAATLAAPRFRFPVSGGLLLAMGALLKLFPMFLFPAYIMMRRFRTVVAIGAWAVALTGFTLLFIPLREFLRFPEVLNTSMYVASSNAEFLQDHSAPSALRYLMAPTAVPPLAILLLRAVPYGAYLAIVAHEGTKRSELSRLLRFSQGFVLLGFVMYRWWEHHLVMLFFPFFVGAYACWRAAPPRVLPAICIAASAAYIGAVNHPSLSRWIDPHLVPAMHGKLAAQLLLLGMLEVLIRKSYRADCSRS